MKKESPLLYFAGMVVAMLLWGVAWTTGKVAALHSNAEVAAFWRYAISFISILPLIWFMKSPLYSNLKGMALMLLAGVLTSLFNYLFFAGLMHGQAGYGGTIVTSISPIITYILSMIFFNLKVSYREIAALAIGLIGALILIKVPTEGLAFLNPENLYFVLAALVWAGVTISAQTALKHTTPMLYTTVVFGIAMSTNLMLALPYSPFAFDQYDATFWWCDHLYGDFSGDVEYGAFFHVNGQGRSAPHRGIYVYRSGRRHLIEHDRLR